MLESVKLAWYAWRPRNTEQLRRENAELRKIISVVISEVEGTNKLMKEYTERLVSILDAVEKKSDENE